MVFGKSSKEEDAPVGGQRVGKKEKGRRKKEKVRCFTFVESSDLIGEL